MLRCATRISTTPQLFAASRTLRHFTCQPILRMPNDPYTDKASDDTTPSQKITDFRAISKAAKFAMLTTVSADGSLHSRAMSPSSDQGLVLNFIGNLDSGKFDELEANSHVNVSFSDASTSDWVSLSGKASILRDVATIKDNWNPATKAWFGDLKDGKHTGNYDDPRVAVIQIVPSEIRYWKRTATAVGQAFDVLKGAVTGEVAAPGVLRVIAGKDLELARDIEDKKL